MEITQVVPSPSLAARPYWFSTSCPNVSGWNSRYGNDSCRTITWVAHGYHFLLGMVVVRGLTLSKRELQTTAEGVFVSPSQYR